MRFYCDARNLRDSWHGYSSAEGDHGLFQEDQGELRRVCCCAARISIIYTLPHALLQPSRTVSLLITRTSWGEPERIQVAQVGKQAACMHARRALHI